MQSFLIKNPCSYSINPGSDREKTTGIFYKKGFFTFPAILSYKKSLQLLGSVDISDQTAGQRPRFEPEICLNPVPDRVMGDPHGSFRRDWFL